MYQHNRNILTCSLLVEYSIHAAHFLNTPPQAVRMHFFGMFTKKSFYIIYISIYSYKSHMHAHISFHISAVRLPPVDSSPRLGFQTLLVPHSAAATPTQ